MKRTHTKTIEYFEHEGDEYRRFSDGSWEWQLWGYSGDSDGWVKLSGNRSTQLEAIYQQPEKCKSCKYYDNNPYLHCAVHPSEPDGVCGDWEESPKVVRNEGTGFNWSMPDSIPAPFRNISHVSVRRRYSAGNHDGAEDGLDDSADLQRTIRQMRPYDSPLRPYDSPLREIPSSYFNESRDRIISYFEDGELVHFDADAPHRFPRNITSRSINHVAIPDYLGEPIRIGFELGRINGESTTVSLPINHPDLHQVSPSEFWLRMDRMTSDSMNMLWNINSCEGQTAVISGGRVVRIDAERAESNSKYVLWEHPDYAFDVETVRMSEEVVTRLDFQDGKLVGSCETRTYTPIIHQVLRANTLRLSDEINRPIRSGLLETSGSERYDESDCMLNGYGLHEIELGVKNGQPVICPTYMNLVNGFGRVEMDRVFADSMNNLWSVLCDPGDDAIIFEGKVVRIEGANGSMWLRPTPQLNRALQELGGLDNLQD